MARPRKLTMDFFIHDADASSDRKIRLLTKKHGNDGYATYFRLLESICHEDGMRLDVSDQETIELLADDFHLRDAPHFLKIVQYCSDIGLINKQLWESERVIFSDGLYRRYESRLQERREAAIRKKRSREAAAIKKKIDQLESEVVTRDNDVTLQLSRNCHFPELQNSETRTQSDTPTEKSGESAAVDDDLELPDHATNFPGQVELSPHLQTIDEVAWQRAYSENKPQQWRPCPISLAVPNTREAIKAAIAATGTEETALEYFGQALAWVAKHETDPFWTKPGHSFTSLINPKSLKFLELAASYQGKFTKPAQARYVAMPFEPMAVVAAKRDVGLAATRGEDWRNVG